MEKLFETGALEELYEARTDGFKSKFILMYGKQKILEKSEEIYNQITENIGKYITDKHEKEKIIELVIDFEEAILDEMHFWEKQYYILGFCDSYYLKKDIITLESIFSLSDNCYQEDFMDLFEEYNSKKLYKEKEYLEAIKTVDELKAKFPKVREFIEDEKCSNLTKEEQRAVLEIIKTREYIDVLEIKEAFMLGHEINKIL